MVPSPYDSTPLSAIRHEIRLAKLSLIHGSEEQPADQRVQCHLFLTSLDDPAKYKALSYRWGDENLRRPMLVNGTLQTVTESLEEALYHMCLSTPDSAVTLWADALCINQQDLVERSQQVPQMKRIYQKADEVIAWLGPAEDKSDLAFEAMNRLGTDADALGIWDVTPETLWKLTSDSAVLKFAKEHCSFDYPWQAVTQVTRRDYFTRVWVIQELALPTKVHFLCGNSQIGFREFCLSLMIMSTMAFVISQDIASIMKDLMDPIKGPRIQTFLGAQVSSRANKIVGLRRRYQNPSNAPQSLIELLGNLYTISSSTEVALCKEPQDKIYGILGLPRDADELAIVPDMTKTVQTVYTETARALLQNGHSDVLAFCQFPKEYTDLPTWVPDWAAAIQTPIGQTVKEAYFAASGSLPVNVRPVSDPGQEPYIALVGATVDVIEQVGSPWLPPVDQATLNYEQAKVYLSDIEKFCALSDRINRPLYQNPQQRMDATWRVPCADQETFTMANVVRRIKGDGADVFQGYKSLLNGLNEGTAHQIKAWQEDPHFRAYAATLTYMFKRRPFCTKEGYVGLAPSHAEPGDVIAIICGAIVPFVLRPVANARYELVGEAYVHGIMDGELVETEKPAKTFVLC